MTYSHMSMKSIHMEGSPEDAETGPPAAGLVHVEAALLPGGNGTASRSAPGVSELGDVRPEHEHVVGGQAAVLLEMSSSAVQVTGGALAGGTEGSGAVMRKQNTTASRLGTPLSLPSPPQASIEPAAAQPSPSSEAAGASRLLVTASVERKVDGVHVPGAANHSVATASSASHAAEGAQASHGAAALVGQGSGGDVAVAGGAVAGAVQARGAGKSTQILREEIAIDLPRSITASGVGVGGSGSAASPHSNSKGNSSYSSIMVSGLGDNSGHSSGSLRGGSASALAADRHESGEQAATAQPSAASVAANTPEQPASSASPRAPELLARESALFTGAPELAATAEGLPDIRDATPPRSAGVVAVRSAVSSHRLAAWLLILGVSILLFGNACFAAGLCISSALWRRSKVGAMRKYVERLPVSRSAELSQRLPAAGGYDCAFSRPVSTKALVRIEVRVLRPSTGSQLTAPLTKRTCVLYSSAVSRQLHDGVHPVPIAFSFACVNFSVQLVDAPEMIIELKGSDVSLFDMYDGRWVEQKSFERIPDDWQDFISSHRTSPHLSSTLRSDSATLEFQECTLCVGALVSVVGELHRNANGTLSMRPWTGGTEASSPKARSPPRESWRTSWEDWSCEDSSNIVDSAHEDSSPKSQSEAEASEEPSVRFEKVMVSDHPELRSISSLCPWSMGQARALFERASTMLSKQLT